MSYLKGVIISNQYIESIIEELKELLIKYSNIDNKKIEESLTTLFSKVKKEPIYSIENLVDFVFFAASLYELKARYLNQNNNELEWEDEIQLLKDRDVAFARLLQFKAFSEVGVAIAAKIKNEETSIPVFKSYQVAESISLPVVSKDIDIDIFKEISEEVFTRYNIIKGFTHIDKDLPDIQLSIDSFINKVNEEIHTTFEDIISNGDYKEAVAYFLALLETVRWGIVNASQAGFDGTISIEKNE